MSTTGIWKPLPALSLPAGSSSHPVMTPVLCPRPPEPSAASHFSNTQRFVWAAKQPLGNAALGALFA